MPDFPSTLYLVSIYSISLAVACTVTIALDEMHRPQKMWIMNLVWPLTTLFGSAIWLAAIIAGAAPPTTTMGTAAIRPSPSRSRRGAAIAVRAARWALGDIIAEWLVFLVPAIAVLFGWHTLFDRKMFAVWIPDFVVAFLIGIVFQYYSIKPMRNLTPVQGVVAAIKADVASISAWQVGMYGLMAAIQFLRFERAYGGTAEVNTPEFWFAMQLAMLAGFCTSCPVNWLLIRFGVKERM